MKTLHIVANVVLLGSVALAVAGCGGSDAADITPQASAAPMAPSPAPSGGTTGVGPGNTSPTSTISSSTFIERVRAVLASTSETALPGAIDFSSCEPDDNSEPVPLS